MSGSDFFTYTPLVRNTLARAKQVNDIIAAIQSGFGYLPAPDLFKQHRLNYALDSGAVNAYVVTLDPAPAAYVSGMTIDLFTANVNTAASTINANGLGVKSILDASGAAVTAGMIVANRANTMRYDGSAFRLVATEVTTTPADGSVTIAKLAATVYASQAEAEAGVENTKLVTPLRVAQRIAAMLGVTLQGYDSDLAAIAALVSAADKMPYATGAGTWALADLTSFARTLLDDASQNAMLTTLGAQIDGAPELRIEGGSGSGSNLQLFAGNSSISRFIFISGAIETIPSTPPLLAVPTENFTVTIASPGVFTLANHGLAVGDMVMFTTSGALPTGLTASTAGNYTPYYVLSTPTASTFTVSALPSGAVVNTSGSQSGTHRIYRKRYIYVYMSAGTMTLEWSATGYAKSGTWGHTIKSGDGTRTLVGMAFDLPTVGWINTEAFRFVRSWFRGSRPPTWFKGAFTTNRSTTSTSNVEINSEARSYWMAWLGERVLHHTELVVSQSGAGGVGESGGFIYDNQPLSAVVNSQHSPGASVAHALPLMEISDAYTEGAHYSTIAGLTASGTLTFLVGGALWGLIG